MTKSARESIQVHLRLDETLDARLERLLEKHPSLRTRTSRIAFALDVGLQAIVGPTARRGGESGE